MERKKGNITFKIFIIIFLLLILDRATKSLALHSLIKSSWYRLLINDGIIFSLPVSNAITTVLVAVIILLLLFTLVRNRNDYSRLTLFSLLLIIVGAASNLYDRIVYGGVVDFLDFGFWTQFNLSDVWIMVGVFILIAKEVRQS